MIISYIESSDINYGSKIIFKGDLRCCNIIASDANSSLDGFFVAAFAQIPQNTSFSLQALFQMLFFFPNEWSS